MWSFRHKNYISLAAGFLVCACSPLSAGQVLLGSIGVYAGLGASPDYQQVLVYNQSNQVDCSTATTFARVCDNINITDWAVEVDTTALIAGFQVAQPPVFNSAATCGGAGCETISTGNDPTANPLYTLPYSVTNACCDTLVTRIVFTGTLQASFNVWLPGALSSSLFFPETPFTVTIDIPGGDLYSTGDAPGYFADLLVNDNPNPGGGGGGGGVPEPATLTLAISGILAVSARRAYRRLRLLTRAAPY
jgi:hypothetical protein